MLFILLATLRLHASRTCRKRVPHSPGEKLATYRRMDEGVCISSSKTNEQTMKQVNKTRYHDPHKLMPIDFLDKFPYLCTARRRASVTAFHRSTRALLKRSVIIAALSAPQWASSPSPSKYLTDSSSMTTPATSLPCSNSARPSACRSTPTESSS